MNVNQSRSTDKFVEATCGECGKEYYHRATNTRSRFCPDCQYARNVEKMREAYVQHDRKAGCDRWTRTAGVCEVVKDPTPTSDGGFSPGARLYSYEIEKMAENKFIVDGFTYQDVGETGNVYRIFNGGIELHDCRVSDKIMGKE